ncbi:16S rRNA (guanine(966)-N(2))-methyltransferase RsmD [Buchnera aphidicola]|uniref:Ribosomal RNA small subunit methyltransferase D n=1 Tax=Buchnera aphidicola subsp. Cinara cedri (strain Cc) TaxID=372461 RepID=Q058F0_BUCCC|nr:16S rRNA (guanine(966)-N(2))-methyltransferase RsmD [Buchnera aphidicola]ABJ90499.1 putative methyltransferase [Buchnera aphidicola BCc]
MKKKIKRKKIRIISGLYKGRIIDLKNKINVRPTRSRIKETVFSWLDKYIKNSVCLDCFAGSGNLSIESVSRLAKSVTALEKNYLLVKKLRHTLLNFLIKNVFVLRVNTIKWLQHFEKPYDIIYLDPPFKKKELLNQSIILLEKYRWIHKNSIIYTEHIDNNINYPKNWKLIKKKKIGNVLFSLFYKKN